MSSPPAGQDELRPSHSPSATLPLDSTTSDRPSAMNGTATALPTPANDAAAADLRKCWICFADESEDAAGTVWRNPCPCALVAHETCLLEWVTNMESTNDYRSSISSTPNLKCPQCKSPIHMRQPLDPIVALTTAFNRITSTLVLPSVTTLTASLVYHAFTAHGAHTIAMIFGPEDGARILAPLVASSRMLRNWDLREIWDDLWDHAGLYLGLPCITPVLLLSRTQLFDTFLPLLPLAFLSVDSVGRRHWAMADTGARKVFEAPSWPPSAAFTIALLPYVRMAYNEYYKRVWSAKVQAWDKALEPPRAGRTEAEAMDIFNNDNDQNNDNNNNNINGDVAGRQDEVDDDDEMHNHDAVFGLRLDANIFPAWAGGAQAVPAVPQAAAAAAPPAAMPAPVVADLDQRNAQPQPGPAPAAPAPAAVPNAANNAGANANANAGAQVQREQRIAFSTMGLAEKVLGSLLFPTASALAGQALLRILPLSWTTTTTTPQSGASLLLFRTLGIRPAGLLQKRWGRSIVGGCLLVVFKDALMLYVKWRMVQQHRQRQVLDYQGEPRIKTAT